MAFSIINRVDSDRAGITVYQSGKIHVLHAEHLPLKIKKKKKNGLLTRQSKEMFIINDEMSLKMTIPQDKRILPNCSCRCGPRPLLFSGTPGWQSGWCWCFSAASVSTSERRQRPAEQWPLWRKKKKKKKSSGFTSSRQEAKGRVLQGWNGNVLIGSTTYSATGWEEGASPGPVTSLFPEKSNKRAGDDFKIGWTRGKKTNKTCRKQHKPTKLAKPLLLWSFLSYRLLNPSYCFV